LTLPTGIIPVVVPPGPRAPGLPFGHNHSVGSIYHLSTPNYPDFHFEWHSGRGRVYIIRLLRDRHGSPEPNQLGELIAFDINDHGSAHNAILIWLRGYQTAANDRDRVPFLRAEDY
jgi:hypothetical protein